MEAPSQTDAFVTGLSEAIGGPAGTHRTMSSKRYWVVVRIVIALACITLTLHWMEKSPCSDGNWGSGRALVPYRHACYTDIVALYNAEGLSEGQVPYKDHAVEYPVLTGAFMGLIGLPVHAYAQSHPNVSPYTLFYNINALILCALAVAAVAILLSLRRRRPWDAAMFAVSPALFLTATVNWDLLAVGFAMFALLAWARKRPTLAAVLIGLGAAAKLWPVFLLVPIVLLGWRARRLGDAIYVCAIAAMAWLAVNLPIMILYWNSWLTFFHLNVTRGVDWGTLWYIGAHVPHHGGYGIWPFTTLQNHVHVVNLLSYLLFGLSCIALAVITVKAPRRPRLGQLAFLVVAAFLVFSKVWSQQYVLWLLPLAIMARPRWGAFLAWQLAEVCYFFAFDGELMGASNPPNPEFPEGVFVLAATLRLVTVLILCGYVIRDIMRPELDAVRQVYDDDPDGGIFDGEPDRWAGSEPALVGI
jgi:uncharacterized membrane protein